jgi:hypothetical protein
MHAVTMIYSRYKRAIADFNHNRPRLNNICNMQHPQPILLRLLLAAGLGAWCQIAPAQRTEFAPQPEYDIVFASESEEDDEIETDRDSFTPAITTVGLHRCVVEMAYSFIDNRNVFETHSYPELLVRYGIGESFELRLGWNYEIGGAGNPISGSVPDDFDTEPVLEEASRLLYGFKTDVTSQQDWLPRSVFMLQGFTPTSGEETITDIAATLVAGWDFSDGWVWDSAIRYSTSGGNEDRFNVWAPSTVLKFPLCEQWKGHVEYFGVFSEGRENESQQHFFSPGAHYLITPNLEIGVRVGWGLNEQAPNFFSNVGGGYRF